ncbi:MAG: sulfite exporter TauE/SafE family protein [Firmicutes bacterium]|nr:sulfite exporter TauE/SafE family protein [Bacillota bacterium]
MRQWLIFAFVGLLAQLVDGSLGMAYGVTSTTLLLASGIAPAVASASVHTAEVITNAISGASHWRFGNVNKRVVLTMALPGAAGAVGGSLLVTHLPATFAAPAIAGFLFLLGLYLFFRFLFNRAQPQVSKLPPRRRFLMPLALFAGFADASGGGGWGPIATPALLAQQGLEPRKVVGSVDTSEGAVSLAATISFWIFLGWSQIDWRWVLALLVGGVIAAPLAAWLVKKVPSHLLGIGVAGIVLLTNERTLLHLFPRLSLPWEVVCYALVGIGWLAALLWVALRHRRTLSRQKQGSSSPVA